jgi:hypothetical protein
MTATPGVRFLPSRVSVGFTRRGGLEDSAPGWRLGGTLGKEPSKRVALKERKISFGRGGDKLLRNSDPLQNLPLLQSGSFVVRIPRVSLRSTLG